MEEVTPAAKKTNSVSQGIFILAIFCLLSHLSRAQNLLANGSFEDENICTEFHINCSPEAWVSTSDVYQNYIKDPKRAFDGVHCIAFIAGNSELKYYRSFVRSQLVCKMRKNLRYRIQFYLRSRYPILDSVGILFTKNDFLFEKTLYHKIIPSLYVRDASTKLTSDTTWQKIIIDYTATGEENFLTIGNFSKRDITGNTGIAQEKHFLVLADKISITPLNPEEKMCPDAKAAIESIYSQNERHELLYRMISFYRKNPPEPPAILQTTFPKTDTIIIPDVLFKTDSYLLNNVNLAILDSIVEKIKRRNMDSLVIEGHTDNVGSVEHNEELSLNRALSVRYYVNAGGVFPSDRIFVRGFASRRPVATNQTSQGRQKNRRVEVYLYSHD